jgi:hypothetical protein
MAETQTQYGIVKATPILPTRDLLAVPHKDKRLVVSHPAFGPNTYSGNLAEMQREYIHSQEQPRIRFKEPTTSESVSACAYDFENLAKPQILDPRWLQLGRIVRNSKGVFANPPKDANGNPIIDENILMQFLNGIEETNGIYLAENNANLRNFGFAAYESFERGVQDCDTFANGGLARLLEYTREKTAKNLREIASPKLYQRGVNVWGFDLVSEPILRVASLLSARGIGGRRAWCGRRQLG